MSFPIANLDAAQCIQGAYDEPNQALRTEDSTIEAAFDSTNNAIRVENLAGNLVPQLYDSIALTYIASGNGAGQIGMVYYYQGGLSGTLVATLTLTYNSASQLISVVNSQEI